MWEVTQARFRALRLFGFNLPETHHLYYWFLSRICG